MKLIEKANLNPDDFCVIRNSCFKKGGESSDSAESGGQDQGKSGSSIGGPRNLNKARKNRQLYQLEEAVNKNQRGEGDKEAPLWFLGQQFFQVCISVISIYIHTYARPWTHVHSYSYYTYSHTHIHLLILILMLIHTYIHTGNQANKHRASGLVRRPRATI